MIRLFHQQPSAENKPTNLSRTSFCNTRTWKTLPAADSLTLCSHILFIRYGGCVAAAHEGVFFSYSDVNEHEHQWVQQLSWPWNRRAPARKQNTLSKIPSRLREATLNTSRTTYGDPCVKRRKAEEDKWFYVCLTPAEVKAVHPHYVNTHTPQDWKEAVSHIARSNMPCFSDIYTTLQTTLHGIKG